MSLAPGTRLGTYEIVALIGAGGMGEVYRARDSRLTRDVALKLLPPLFARDPERLARFTREANVLATLNHPNIAAIYGFETSDHSPALILEMVEGATLADRIAQGPLPLDETLPLARQIAEALEAAHAQGIVHRDLKPANVKVRDDGTVKVLDFGLAKAMSADSSPAAVAASPTITSPAATAMGTIMGTAAYMSPEQARGRTVDKRSDIWAFGAVLYEMLTGRRVFDGEDVSDTLANVLKREPDWSMLPADTPAPIERVLRRCLTKDARLRIHDIADVRIELDDRASIESAPARSLPSRSSKSFGAYERAAWGGLAIALAAIAAFALWRGRAAEPQERSVLRFQIAPPDNHSFGALGVPDAGGSPVGAPAISPDGTRLAFHAADSSGNGALWLRALDSFDSTRLPRTEGGTQPFWSPDGTSIAFFAGRRLYKLDVVRGERTELCAFEGNPRGGSWGTAGTIIFTITNPPAALTVPSQGGKPTLLTLPGPKDGISPPTWPSFLPDGRRFLYFGRTRTEAGGGIYLATIGSETPTRVTDSDTQAVFAEPGYLLFARDARLVRLPFDVQSGRASGDAVPVIEQLRMMVSLRYGEFSVSKNGVLAYRSGLDASMQFTWTDRKGKPLSTVGSRGNYRTSALSPDGTRLVYTDASDGNLKLLDIQTGIIILFTSDAGTETAPVWSTDGKTIYYRSDRGGLFFKPVDGTSPATKILDDSINGPMQYLEHKTFGPLLLYFQGQPMRPSMDIFMLPLTGKREPHAIVETPFADVEPQVSPDGKWLAYASGDMGAYEIDVMPFPKGSGRVRVSRAGGRQPYWRGDSRELFFVSDTRKFYALKVPEGGPSRDIEPELLFNMHANVANTRNSYVPSKDGQRFLVHQVLDTQDAPISIITNWPATIK